MLNLKTISKILGALLGIEALLMSLCLFVSLWYKDNDIAAFLWAILITVVTGAVFRLMGSAPTHHCPPRRLLLGSSNVGHILAFRHAAFPNQRLHSEFHQCFL